MSIQLTEPVRSFFLLSNGAATSLVTQCFSEDAVVHDEGQIHEGWSAIQKWIGETRDKYQYTAEPQRVEQENEKTLVTTKIIGNFPGSPIQLRYVFQINDKKIKSLEVTP